MYEPGFDGERRWRNGGWRAVSRHEEPGGDTTHRVVGESLVTRIRHIGEPSGRNHFRTSSWRRVHDGRKDASRYVREDRTRCEVELHVVDVDDMHLQDY